MISSDLIQKLSELLGKKLKSKVHIERFHPVAGGCINRCYMLKSTAGKFFLKINSASRFPGMFEAEAKGLLLLKSANALRVPEVIGSEEYNDTCFLVLEFIEPGARKNNFFENFGRNLAKLHKHSAETFGLHHDNYIGSLKQSNNQRVDWIDFFVQERLKKQIALAKTKSLISASLESSFDRLFIQLRNIFPKEKPALLHGDLWSGNFIVSSEGQACIIDPAVYFGHREMDIAMTKLFGGFAEEFYSAYNNEFPLEKEWEKRIEICNLYPLMVHVNLFGRGYLSQVQSILKNF